MGCDWSEPPTRDEDCSARLRIKWSVTSADVSQIFSAVKEFESIGAIQIYPRNVVLFLYDKNQVLQTINNTGGTLHP